MYKTIRHGENSLQYTILPQNDDFRMDGKITGSGSSHKPKRGKRRSFFAYLGLLFVCTVIVGAILVPFLVSAECLPNPSDWFMRTRSALLDSVRNSSQSRPASDNETQSTIKSYPDSSSSNQIQRTSEQPTTLRSDNNNNGGGTSDNIFTIPILSDNNKKPLLNRVVVRTESSVVMDRIVTETPMLVRKITEAAPPSPPTAPVKPETEAVPVKTSPPTTVGLAAAATMSVLSTTSKKPIILPVLARTNSIVRENGKAIERRAEPKNWIRSHWPFIDPSTYFQWAGYKSEDSVLLPAILGVALIGIILIITLCLVARNKRTIVASVRKRNRNDIEDSGEDNTTLLTTGNLSDDD